MLTNQKWSTSTVVSRLWQIVAKLYPILLLLACSTPPMSQDTSGASQWRIEANLYSGKPNPYGYLSNEQGQTFLDMVQNLAGGAPMEMGGLGYSGFTLHPSPSTLTDIQSITIYHGTVEVTRANQTVYMADPDRTLERWLFETVETSDWLSGSEKQTIHDQFLTN